jgi:hypothetical protein
MWLYLLLLLREIMKSQNDELGRCTSRNEALIFQHMSSIHLSLMSMCILKMVKVCTSLKKSPSTHSSSI